MKKDDSFQALLSMTPGLKEAYEILLPETMSKHLQKKTLISLKKFIKTFITTLIINNISKDFIRKTRADISMYVSDILNLQSSEKLKRLLISNYGKRGIHISEEAVESMLEDIDIYVKQVINYVQGENNG